MSLIKCPVCEKDVSDKASSCPHCGEPFKSTVEENEVKSILVGESRDAAIKRVRKLQGCGFEAAKQYVAKLESLLSPAESAAVKMRENRNTGCAVMVLGVVGIGMIWFVYTINSPPTPPPSPPPLTVEQNEFGLTPSIIHDDKHQPIVSAVRDYLVPRLKDPDSLHFIQFTNPITKELQGKKGWVVVTKYRAKNSLGDYTDDEAIALIRDDKVVLWLNPDGTETEPR